MNTPYHNNQEFLSHISIDSVVFGFHENELKVLLLELKDLEKYALPGGFVKKDETIEDAASRILKWRTGLDEIFLQQFKVFSSPDRSKDNPTIPIIKSLIPNIDISFYNDRFISIGFFALVEYTLVNPNPDELSIKCEWVNIDDAKNVIIDHSDIINGALEALRIQLNYSPIGYNLLPQKFTMPELQKLYETILGKQLDRRNFQRKILSYNILNRLDEKRVGVAHKSPYLYEFDLENYQKALENGLKSGW
ncbi:NUDIX hydrolase [Carboxylicivirga linearis]|uniref:NUDIX hydrolase n=1 Tax=Carboxylicivirga linearis TaxID=1628157 RepID=A0ABS5JXY5_9BACT|nr:NUDIX domain-containing protein [Carboxylicivirga linearis]MBS2099797.1 NUDIX hydrolase [Carboxylicivirga linearis]